MKDFLKSWGLLIGALGIGLLAFFTATAYLNNKEANIRDSILGRAGEVKAVVVATRDLAVGDVVGGDNMAIAEVASDHLSTSVITPDTFDNYNGQILRVPLSQGEPLLSHSVQGQLIERFSDLIDEGERAITIEVNTLTSNAGLLAVGDFVDIFLQGEFDGSSEDSLVPLFERIKVLAVDRHPLLTKEQEYRSQDFFEEEEGLDYSSVTLSLGSDNANDLAFAASLGELVFLLRNSKDTRRANYDLVDPKSLFSSSNNPSNEFAYFSNQGAAMMPKSPTSSEQSIRKRNVFAHSQISVPIISTSTISTNLNQNESKITRDSIEQSEVIDTQDVQASKEPKSSDNIENHSKSE